MIENVVTHEGYRNKGYGTRLLKEALEIGQGEGCYKVMLKRFFKVIIIAGLLWFLSHTILITIDGLADNLGQCDVGIVLGNKVELDGTPSQRLQGRLDKAAELYKDKYFQYIIVSGGTGKEGFDEAKVMKNYLVKAGIPENVIIEDSHGVDTFMTAKNSKVIMNRNNFQSAMVITQYYHITRTTLAMHKVGINKVYSAHARTFELRDLYSLTREF
ncbi:GNAT family N-acetyltransferase, partial [Dehalobacter sp. UNSWDHB]|uniref:GNAT family N-acetyltransferase n=1 Tax=Dehalobacter sp. UNSWDHB TaxID=1339256 RepID=UPI001FA71C22